MKRRSKLSGRMLTALTMLFLYLPIFVLIAFSFNSTKSRTIWSGFSTRWYVELFRDGEILRALSTTLSVSVIAALVATIAGTFAAVGFYAMRRRTRSALLTINNIPVMNADIITGVSMSLLFFTGFGILNDWLGLNLEFGFGTLLIAHITFNIPYVILSVNPKLGQLDKNLFEAAQDLGCTWMQAFVKVILPQIKPGIVNGMIIAFTLSVDDFVISYFTAGSKVQTLAMVINAMTRRKVSPVINAVSALLFAAVLLLLIIINVREARQQKALEQKQKIHKIRS
jgi:spermidine/putrescine transport system permease protein